MKYADDFTIVKGEKAGLSWFRASPLTAALLGAAVILAGAAAHTGERRGDVRPAGAQTPDRTPSALIELDGSESYNPEGEDLHFEWRQLDGPRVELSNPHVPKPYFRTSQPGYYVFELVVTANGMKSDPFVLDFEIEMMNLPPVAKAPDEVRGEVGKLIEVDGRDSFDPEGSNLTYRWRGLTRGLDIPLSALNRPVLAFEPTLDGVFEVELVVSDGESVSPPVVTRLLVRPKPKPPVARAKINALEIPTAPAPEQAMAPPAGARPVASIQGPAVAQVGTPVLLDARSSRGAEGSRLEYLWRQKAGPFINDFSLVFDGAAQRFSAPRVGDYEFELVVSDGKLESDPILHRVKVMGEAQPPVAVVEYPARSLPGALVKMDATQSYDMEGSKLSFHWRQTGGPTVNSYVIDETLGEKAPAFYPPVPAVYSYELIVDNGKTKSKPFEIHIEVGDARRPPRISIKGVEVASTGERVSLGANCEDSGDRNLTFMWKQVEGPAKALPDTPGDHVEIAPSLPGRYIVDLTALENGKVVATARRTLEVFDPPGTSRPVSHPNAEFMEPITPMEPIVPMEPIAPVAPVGSGRVPQLAPLTGAQQGSMPVAPPAPITPPQPPASPSVPGMGASTTLPSGPGVPSTRGKEPRGRSAAQIHPSTRGS